MLLTTALMRSLHGIATRRILLRKNSNGKEVFEYQLAAASDKGVIHIFRGLTGSIRRLEAVDQLLVDWEPFQEIDAWTGPRKLKTDPSVKPPKPADGKVPNRQTRVCTMCSAPYYAKGYCRSHYNKSKWRKGNSNEND